MRAQAPLRAPRASARLAAFAHGCALHLRRWQPQLPCFATLALVGAVPVILLVARTWLTGKASYHFLVWNLFLGLVPLVLVWFYRRFALDGWWRWLRRSALLLTVLALPNSFYVMTDLIHLHASLEIHVLYDAIMLCSFVLAGMVYGLATLLLIHDTMLRTGSPWTSGLLVGLILLASSFAIYLGRFLRWNSWDLLTRPQSVLADVGARLLDPVTHWPTYAVSGLLFLVITSLYCCVWCAHRQGRAGY